MSRSMPGRRTLTTTSRPSRVRARWTCAIEPAASDQSSNQANALSTGRPSSSAMRRLITSVGSALALSCSWASSRAIGGENRSSRVDRNCPSLMKVGPSALSARDSRRP